MLEVGGLSKEYPSPNGVIPVLDDLSFALNRGGALSIMGPSGGGKSTLLFILGALEPPTSGKIVLDGTNPFQLGQRELAIFRNRHVGFVFQDHCLLPQCSVLENVLIPTLVCRENDYHSRAIELLNLVGMEERMQHRPAELSGGEKQRVAIARALIREPTLLLLDEPTGNLDEQTAENVASLLSDLHGGGDRILIIVTHNPKLADCFPTRMRLESGKLHPK